MELALWALVFIISLAVLIKAADLFIDAVQQLGEQLSVPSFILGATVVAAGTSLPELITSTFAVLEGSTNIVVGNVVGSNVSNILLVIGLSIFASRKFEIKFKRFRWDFLFLISSAIVLSTFVVSGGVGMIEGIIFTTALAIYLFYVLTYHKQFPDDVEEQKQVKEKLDWKQVAIFIASGMAISASAKFTVDATVEIAGILQVGEEVIALSVLALGTSLPELVVSIAAARKDATDIIVGNIIGSNIFNTFGVMGIPALIKPLDIPAEVIGFSLPMMLGATLLLCILAALGRTASLAGIFMIVLYLFFIIGTFMGFTFFEWN